MTNQPAKTIKDLVRLFFIYSVPGFPVCDNFNNFIGIIKKNDTIKHSTDISNLSIPLELFITQNITKIDETSILNFISDVSSTSKFPVLNFKGEILDYWTKKDLIGLIYNYPNSSKLNSDLILNSIPEIFVTVDKENKIIQASNYFLKEFEFNIDFLLNHKISRFFPKILLKPNKSDFYPKKHKINYQHKLWNYQIILIKSGKNELGYLYLFNELKTLEIEEEINYNMSLSNILEIQEKKIIKKVLDKHSWNIHNAAKQLKLSKQMLQYKLAKYKLAPR